MTNIYPESKSNLSARCAGLDWIGLDYDRKKSCPRLDEARIKVCIYVFRERAGEAGESHKIQKGPEGLSKACSKLKKMKVDHQTTC